MDTPLTLLNRLRLLLNSNRPVSPKQNPCYWHTDLHSHLIPGIDDGVSTNDDALLCLRQLADWGIRHVVTTPHVSQDWFPNTHETLLAGQTTLRNLIAEHQLPLTLEVAAEYLIDDLFLDRLRAGNLLSFGQPRHVLFETGWASAPHFLSEIIFQLQTHRYQPVLAHPERYTYYHDDLTPLADLRTAGCLFQLNWGSLTGRYGKRVEKQAQKLLKNNWVDFIGSDLHRPTDLPSLEKLFTTPAYTQLRQQPLRNQIILPKQIIGQ